MDKKFTQKTLSGNKMSIADLFSGAVIGSSSTTASFSEDAESSKFLKVYEEQEKRFVPQIDFTTASNFAKFGSATSYYEDAFTRIHNQYPYDGSQREKVLWNLSSSYLDKHIFDNVYPRTNGYIKINSGSSTYTATATSNWYSSSSPQYIYCKGGPHADPYGNYKLDIESGKSSTAISKANVYNTASARANNLEVNLENGHTIEFWMKKDGWADPGSAKEIIFANFQTGSSYDDAYMWVYTSTAAKGNIYYQCSKNPDDTGIITLDTGLSDIADSQWHHYAVASKTSGSTTAINLYVDGVYTTKQTPGSDKIITAFTGALHAGIGAMPGPLEYAGTAYYAAGYGNIVSASFDEFRYWKTERTAKQVGRYYIDQINGGTNTDTANTDLGVYYKFNEGITQTASVDQTILDYSGRISNGSFISYNSDRCRSTGSAIVESGIADREFKDPIIYSYHPTVKSTLSDLKIKGNEHDFNNSNSLINSIPAWIVENDAVEGNNHLEKLIQILSNYLDTLYLQVEALPTIKNINYPSGSSKPHFFNDRLLKDYGFNVDEILTDVDLFAFANTRDEKKIFEKKLYDVKNQIYKNIYNNLVYIYKTKGTKKSFRNLLRCIGIDEELVRLNLYGRNTDWTARTNTRNVSSKTKYVDFYNNNSAVVYGYSEAGNTNSTSFISGSENITSGIDKLSPITIEADIVFPKYPLNEGNYSKSYTSMTSSMFGVHSVKHPSSPNNLTWANNDISASIQAYSIRKTKQTSENNPEVYFAISGSMFGMLTSSVFNDVYQSSKWKFGIRLASSKYSQIDFVSGTLSDESTNIEFYGAQMIGDSVLNQFNVTGQLAAAYKYSPFVSAKRLYCGANRTNFTGTVLQTSDVFVSNVRYWNSYLSDDVLLYHAKNDASYGTQHPYKNTYLFEGKDSTGLAQTEMPQISSLALNWNFDQVTGSDSSGRFTVVDFSSGSASSNDYKLSNIVQMQHTARGDYFSNSSSGVVEKKYEASTRLVPFDQLNSDDMVEIVDFEGEIFTRESRPQEYFFALEKSMYANVSDEMLNMFSTIRDFHNIVGEPVNRYRKDYKEMGKLRELFFKRVGNTPDIEKFVEYYKWIDNSISSMLMNLVPATANFSENIRTLIESHVLERNKIETKFPTLELKQPEPVGRIKAINELTYDWKHGHRPLNNEQDDNCLYWKDRAERDGGTTTSGNSAVDSQRETIRRITNSVVSGSTYVLRKLTRPYRFSAKRTEDLGIDNIKLNFVKTELDRSGKTDNIVFQNIETIKDCDDNAALNTKQRLDFQAKVNDSLHKGRNLAPFTLYTSSVTSGYKGALSTMQAGLEVNDNHRDVYGTETQESLQGPFSKIHVGGKKSRKVVPFTTTDRLEEYDLTVNASNLTLSKRAAADPKSKYFLDEIAKRPVVIRNIKTSTSSLYLGNYSKEYQIVQTVGADTQRGWLKDNFNSVTQITAEVLNLTGNLNFDTFARTGSSLQSVTIADRFSGPGSPESLSPGYLDPASHTYSVYNGINYRNITVRLPRTNIQHSGANALAYYKYKPFGAPGISETGSLRVLQTGVPLNALMRNPMCGPYAGYGGYDMKLLSADGIPVTASIHKVNRNKINVAKTSLDAGVGYVVYTPRFDNGFVQHAIPQSDRQYSWITASLLRSYEGPNINVPQFSAGNGDTLTAPLGYSVKKDDTTFISASEYGAAWGGAGIYLFHNQIDPTARAFHPIDFVGLNTIIREPLTASENHLGQPPGVSMVDPGLFVGDTLGYPGFYTSIYRVANDTPGLRRADSVIFNALINHRQGPYGWPTWKQIRGGNHPIMRNHRLTNTLSMIDRPVSIPKQSNTGERRIINLTESVVTVNYKPIHVRALLKGVGPKGSPIDSPTAISQDFKFTYGNDTAYFAENKIFDSLAAYNYEEIFKASRSRSEAYKAITNLYLPTGTDADSLINPVQGFVSLNASQIVWPRTRNTFLNRTRARNNYTEEAGLGSNGYDRISHRTFWRDKIADRPRTNQSALNSQGLPQTIQPYPGATGTGIAFGQFGPQAALTVWPLDGRYTGSVTDLNLITSGAAGAGTNLNWAAMAFTPSGGGYILQQGISGSAGELFTSGMYRTYKLIGSNYYVSNRFVTASARYHGVDWNMSAYSGTATGGPWSGIGPWYPQILQYTASSNINWTTNIDAGKNPWHDSYEEYSADLRIIGKDYSIIPEFNMSDHMEYYTTLKQSDFLAPLPTDRFIIHGINNSSSVNSTFYDEYSHSDFLKNFDLVINDHKSIAGVKAIKMTCHGLKKLLPYNGFYPVTRTLQMATLLSQSIGSQIFGSGSGYEAGTGEVYPALPETQGLQALLQPFFAPGILYNTIKSGIAVDFPVFTGSAPVTSLDGLLANDAYFKSYLSGAVNYRLPFETLYDLNNLPIFSFTRDTAANKNKIYAVTNENTDAFFHWTGERNNNLYELAMNNFLAESVNLFLHEGKLTSFKSKPMSQITFKEDIVYKMSIDIEKTTNFLMTEGASADSVVNSDIFLGAQYDSRSHGFQGTSKRGIIYGPATRFFDYKTLDSSGNATLSASGWPYCEQNDPAFAPYTPPYFYGKSTVDLTYKNTVDDTPTPNLATIFGNITASYTNDLGLIPTGSYYTASNASNDGAPWRSVISASSPAMQTMMQISSSLNLFGLTNDLLKTTAPDGTIISQADPEDPTSLERWVISTKYECPVLNFNQHTDDTKARGMWNGYGNIPDYSSEGIRITLRETDPAALYGAQNLTSGSLLQKFFGDSQAAPVGQLPNNLEKSISECIVAIPFLPGNNGSNAAAAMYNCYYSSDDDKFFFPISKAPISNLAGGGASSGNLSEFKESATALMEKMKRFVFPPRYDFVNNTEPAIPPFTMFTFEFKHNFTRQELADIWQGVMPDISTRVVPETTTLNIPVAPGELMGEVFKDITKKEKSDAVTTAVVKNLRWMIFKVKQRARNVYANVTEDITDNLVGIAAGGKFYVESDHNYSYNWPYDFCSLVELAKFEAGVEIKK
jgi:hypothetical protein